MRTMLYLLAISAGLTLAAGPAVAESDSSSEAKGGSLAAGDYEVDEYDPKKHPVDKRNLANRPVWWWTHPMCRPKLRHLGNCDLELDKPALETEPEEREHAGR